MADSSKDIQLRELKDMITDLKNLIKRQLSMPEINGKKPLHRSVIT